MRHALFLILGIILLPAPALAQVVISEFLYDASGTDTDQEYIEIYNAGAAPVDLSKWKVSDGSNHTLNAPPKNGGTGSISIAPGEYALLVNDASGFRAAHASVSGTVIDTVLSLSNTGSTLALVDGDGTTIDSVSYTKDLGGAGDGNSLQKVGAVWAVATPSPNSANTSSGTADTETQTETATTTPTTAATTTSATTTQTTTQVPLSSYVPPPVAVLFADGGDNRTVIVGADTEFRGRAYNRKQDLVDNVRFSWNFGDGTTKEGANVVHHYDYPGTYMAVLLIALDRNAVYDRIVVTAEPARLTFTVFPDGSVGIENRAGRDLDLSKWIIRSFGREFVLPEESIVVSGATLRIAQKTIQFAVGDETELLYPNGFRALKAGESTAEAPTPPQPAASVGFAPIATFNPAVSEDADDVPRIDIGIEYAEPDEASGDAEGSESVEDQATSTQVAAAASTDAGTGYQWWLGAGVLAVGAAGAAAYVQRKKKTEWDIVEES